MDDPRVAEHHIPELDDEERLTLYRIHEALKTGGAITLIGESPTMKGLVKKGMFSERDIVAGSFLGSSQRYTHYELTPLGAQVCRGVAELIPSLTAQGLWPPWVRSE